MLFDPLPPTVRDSLYATVGLPVVLAEEVGRATRRLAADLDRRLTVVDRHLGPVVPRVGELVPPWAASPPSLDELNRRLETQLRGIEDRVSQLEDRVEHTLDRIEAQLPDTARDVLVRGRDAAREARTQLRALVS